MNEPTALKHRRGTTRIVWCVEAEDLSAQSQNLLRANVAGWCVESCFDHLPQTLEFLQHGSQHHSPQALPALMLSLSTYVRCILQTHNVSSQKEDLAHNSGDTFWIQTQKAPASSSRPSLHLLSPERLREALEIGDILYWGYGEGSFKVLAIEKTRIQVQVKESGLLPPTTTLYLGGKKNRTMSQIKALNTAELLDVGVNYFVLPGCLEEEDVSGLRQEFPRDDERSPWLIYRVDSASSLQRCASILPWVDGVMISRRELALTAHPQHVPMVTKTLVRSCREQAKLTIVASHMLASMQSHTTPTRAEVSDVANAVYDGADALMLSEDTLKGPYALQAIEVAHKVITDVEEHHNHLRMGGEHQLIIQPKEEMDVICVQAAKTARRVNAKALVCITKTGNTAVRLSSINTHLPIIAITFHRRIARKLRLLRGVDSLVLKTNPNLDEVLPRVNELLKNMSWLKKGDSFVFVTVTLSSMSHEASNLFTIQSIY